MPDWSYSQPCVAMPARSRKAERPPSAATSRHASSVSPSASATDIASRRLSKPVTGCGAQRDALGLAGARPAHRSGSGSRSCARTAAAGASASPSACACAASRATSPAKVRNTGRITSSRRLSVTIMSRIGCAFGATLLQMPSASNRFLPGGDDRRGPRIAARSQCQRRVGDDDIEGRPKALAQREGKREAGKAAAADDDAFLFSHLRNLCPGALPANPCHGGSAARHQGLAILAAPSSASPPPEHRCSKSRSNCSSCSTSSRSRSTCFAASARRRSGRACSADR